MPVDYLIGVDLGGTKIHTALATGNGDIVAETRIPTKTARGSAFVIGQIAATVRQLLKQVGVSPASIKVIALGSPGPLDISRGVIQFSPNLHWHDVPVKLLLEEQLSIKVIIDNDANAAALGEYMFGAGKGTKNMVYITVSTGVGGGLILGGQLYHGSSDGAGEIGHTIVLPDGPLCNCGARGCLEALSSGTAIAREARCLVNRGGGKNILNRAGGDPGEINSVVVAAAAAEGDPEAALIIDQASRYLGIGVANVINLLNPDMVVLGGGVMEIGEPVWRGIRQEVQSRAFQPSRERAQIVPAALGQRSGVIGAIALAMQ
ncbi:MAG: Glucokinase [Pelotomaculum sp. PtaB.Bin104]|nr:MAG: Glucokinase [Pelotomaculum sp. PtaB.Bin104]